MNNIDLINAPDDLEKGIRYHVIASVGQDSVVHNGQIKNARQLFIELANMIDRQARINRLIKDKHDYVARWSAGWTLEFNVIECREEAISRFKQLYEFDRMIEYVFKKYNIPYEPRD